MVLLVKRLIFGCEIVAWELFVVLDEEGQNAIASFKDTSRLDPNQSIAKGGGQRAEGIRVFISSSRYAISWKLAYFLLHLFSLPTLAVWSE
jgi:hypothetical protein